MKILQEFYITLRHSLRKVPAQTNSTKIVSATRAGRDKTIAMALSNRNLRATMTNNKLLRKSTCSKDKHAKFKHVKVNLTHDVQHIHFADFNHSNPEVFAHFNQAIPSASSTALQDSVRDICNFVHQEHGSR